MNDGNMQTVSIISTAVLTAALSIGVWKGSEWAEAAAATKKNPYEDMEVIDASLAELPKKPQQQPQKQFRAPDPETKPMGVSRDETREPVVKPDEPPKKATAPSLDQFRRDNTDDDEPIGKPDEQPVGAFDGSEFGFGDETRGDPYLGALKADLLRSWEYPEILSDVGTPVGCIHIEPDGKIEEAELREKSGNDELDDSVERALTGLQKLRNKEPRPVPAHLIPKTRKWICWRMKVKE